MPNQIKKNTQKKNNNKAHHSQDSVVTTPSDAPDTDACIVVGAAGGTHSRAVGVSSSFGPHPVVGRPALSSVVTAVSECLATLPPRQPVALHVQLGDNKLARRRAATSHTAPPPVSPGGRLQTKIKTTGPHPAAAKEGHEGHGMHRNGVAVAMRERRSLPEQVGHRQPRRLGKHVSSYSPRRLTNAHTPAPAAACEASHQTGAPQKLTPLSK